MNNTYKYFRAIAAVAILLMVVSCNTAEIEEITVEKGSIVKIPYSLSVSAAGTKVSYAGGQYAIKSGDALKITGESRTDIAGTLTFDSGNKFTGEIEYDYAEGDIDDNTKLVATLIHADNDVESTYANGIALSVQDAVEKYSLLSTDAFNFNVSASADNPQKVNLVQRTAFLDVTVSFTDLLLGSMPTGDTPAEIVLADNTSVSGMGTIVNEGTDYHAKFVAALPGGTEMKGSKVVVCDRDVDIIAGDGASKELANNNLYSVVRSVSFSPKVGDPFWSDGTYGSISHESGVSIIGIIVYVDQDGTADDGVTEKDSGFGHALVMSLHNVPYDGGIKWSNEKILRSESTTTTITEAVNSMEGYKKTKKWLVDDNLTQNQVTAAYLARHYRGSENGLDIPSGTTGWFLASTGQWIYSICAPGFLGCDSWTTWKDGDGNDWYAEDKDLGTALAKVMKGQTALNDLFNTRFEELRATFAPDIAAGDFFDAFGMTNDSGEYSDNYWTSNEYDKNQALRMNFGCDKTNTWSSIKITGVSKSATYAWREAFIMKVRPFVAF